MGDEEIWGHAGMYLLLDEWFAPDSHCRRSAQVVLSGLALWRVRPVGEKRWLLSLPRLKPDSLRQRAGAVPGLIPPEIAVKNLEIVACITAVFRKFFADLFDSHSLAYLAGDGLPSSRTSRKQRIILSQGD
jgi:hypothetical protein